MRTARLLVLMTIAAAGSAGAQQPPPSPYDTNPKCLQRDIAPDDPDCVIPKEGTPRHTYPPPRKKAPQQPPPPPKDPPAQHKEFLTPGNNGKAR